MEKVSKTFTFTNDERTLASHDMPSLWDSKTLDAGIEFALTFRLAEIQIETDEEELPKYFHVKEMSRKELGKKSQEKSLDILEFDKKTPEEVMISEMKKSVFEPWVKERIAYIDRLKQTS
jgi:hypothetical protein